MKKIFSVVLSLAIIMLSFTTFAASTPTMKLAVGNSEIRAGDIVELSVELSDNPGVCAFMFTITYDTDAFEVVKSLTKPKYDLGDNFSNGMISMTGGEEGKITFTYVANSANNTTENGTLVTFKFKTKAENGEYNFNLVRTNQSVIAGTSNGQEIVFDIQDACVTVGEKGASLPIVTDALPKTVTLVLGDDGESFKVPYGISINVGDTVVLPKGCPISIGGVRHSMNENGEFYIKHNGKVVFTSETAFSFKVCAGGSYSYHAVKWSIPHKLGMGKELVSFEVSAAAKGAVLAKLPFNIVTLKRDALRLLSSLLK